MASPDLPPLQWRKSTRSSGNGNCVEFADQGDLVTVRDTKDRNGPWLRFNPEGWRVFIEGVQHGQFD